MKKPKDVETIGDAVNFAVKEIKQGGNGTVEAILFYGNTLFSYDYSMNIEDIPKKEFKQDVKFDFFVFVNDLKKYHSGKEKDEDDECSDGNNLAEINEKYPLYFNECEGGIKWKTGIYDLEYAMKNTSFQKKNLFLAGRLHKPVDIKYCRKSSEKDIEGMLYRAKREGMEMALNRLKRFSYDNLIYNIIKTNYLAESWRFEFYKPRDIFKKAKDRLKEDYIPVLEEKVSKKEIIVLGNKNYNRERLDDIEFINLNYSISNHASALYELFNLNFPSIKISMKQIRTNKGGIIKYVGRKAKKILLNTMPFKK